MSNILFKPERNHAEIIYIWLQPALLLHALCIALCVIKRLKCCLEVWLLNLFVGGPKFKTLMGLLSFFYLLLFSVLLLLALKLFCYLLNYWVVIELSNVIIKLFIFEVINYHFIELWVANIELVDFWLLNCYQSIELLRKIPQHSNYWIIWNSIGFMGEVGGGICDDIHSLVVTVKFLAYLSWP